MCIKRIKNVEFDLSFYTIDGKWVFAAIDNSKNTNIFLNEEKLKSSLFCKYLWEIPNDFSLSNSFPSTLCFLPLSLSQPILQIASPTLHMKNKNDSFMIIKKICEIKQKETTKHSTWKIKHRPSEKDSKK